MKLRSLLPVIALVALITAIPQSAWAKEASLQATPAEIASSEQADSAPEQEPSIAYQVKIGTKWQAEQKDGEQAATPSTSQKVLGVKATVEGPVDAHVQYAVHTSKAGWKPSVRDGKKLSVSQPDFIDAVRISLLGELSKTYSVTYRVYIDGVGWSSWVGDSTTAGNVGAGQAIAALEAKLVKKSAASLAPNKGIIGVTYRVKTSSGWSMGVRNYSKAGTTSQAQRIKAFQIGIDAGAYGGSLQYRIHRTNKGWGNWLDSWKSTGTKKDIDAIELRLTGELATRYDIVYRSHVPGIGWQKRLRNGETAGIAGSGIGIDALKAKLELKSKRSGWIGSGSRWSYYKKGKMARGTWLDTTESPIDMRDTTKRRYWIDADGILAVNRYVNPKKTRDAKGYVAYATENGYVFCGKRATEKGITLADSQGRLITSKGFLKTAAYDGKKQIYYMKKSGLYSVARTGMFKVGGKRYYGYEDDRGYLMRSNVWWLSGKWYQANKNGVLKNVNNQTTKHINRYVKWAVRIANDNSHGYSQYNRQGPDYDCSSLVCNALLAAGFPNSGASWTGNMRDCLTRIGFVWHDGTAGLRRGDIMLVHTDYRQHTEIYLGNGKLVGAHIAETGGIHGVAGDQTGNEISVTRYYNAPWQGYLRYRG